MSDTHRLQPGKHISLADIPTDATPFYRGGSKTAVAEFESLREELIDLQVRLYAESKRKLLIIFQAIDAGGKDGAIRHVFKGVNPQGVYVYSFKVPSKLELAHDYLWRVHKVVPQTGMIGVFNRSHYEDVLVVRVDNIVPESVWRLRYEHINQFERLLHDTGTTILKFFLHISPEEQAKRFQARLDDPTKHWKFALEDLEKRKQWPDYMAAFTDMLNLCTTPWAPWYVIPADLKWYRNLAVTLVIVDTLRDMNPQYPITGEDLSNVIIR